MILSLGETKLAILPYHIDGSGLQSVVNIFQVPFLLLSVVFYNSGELVV